MSFALPLAVWNLTTFFKQMPFELEQAAQMDGCTPGQEVGKVINKKEMQTATVSVSKFTGAYGFARPFGTQMTAGVIVTVPLVVAVLVFQRRIVAGLTARGVK